MEKGSFHLKIGPIHLHCIFNNYFNTCLLYLSSNELKIGSIHLKMGPVDFKISDSFEQEKGVPQGSILSVTHFGIKIKSFAKVLINDMHRICVLL